MNHFDCVLRRYLTICFSLTVLVLIEVAGCCGDHQKAGIVETRSNLQSPIEWRTVNVADVGDHHPTFPTLEALLPEIKAFSDQRARMTTLQLGDLQKSNGKDPLDFGNELLGRRFHVRLFVRDIKRTMFSIEVDLSWAADLVDRSSLRETHLVNGRQIYKECESIGALLRKWKITLVLPSDAPADAVDFSRGDSVEFDGTIDRAEIIVHPRGGQFEIEQGAYVRFKPDSPLLRGKTPTEHRRVVFAVDKSGSMVDSFLQVKHRIVEEVLSLSPTDQVAMVAFNDGEPGTWAMAPATDDQKQVLTSALEQMTAEGQSTFQSALRTIAAMAPTDVWIVSDLDFSDDRATVLNETSRATRAGIRFHIRMPYADNMWMDDLNDLRNQVCANGGSFYLMRLGR